MIHYHAPSFHVVRDGQPVFDFEEDFFYPEDEEEAEALFADTQDPSPNTHLCDGPQCVNCGCCEHHACSEGCVWATANLCSRCARECV